MLPHGRDRAHECVHESSIHVAVVSDSSDGDGDDGGDGDILMQYGGGGSVRDIIAVTFMNLASEVENFTLPHTSEHLDALTA